MTETNGALRNGARAKAFKERARKELDLGDELSVTIRKLAPVDLFSTGQLPPALALGEQSVKEAQAHVRDRFLAGENPPAEIQRRTVALGVIDPPVWTGSPRLCPDDHVLIDDLAEHLHTIYVAVLEFSGFDALLERGASFRGGDGSGDDGDAVGASVGADSEPSAPDAPRGVRSGSRAPRSKRS